MAKKPQKQQTAPPPQDDEAGNLSQGLDQQPESGAAPEDDQQEATQDEQSGGGMKANPQQQAEYNKFVDNGYLLIYPKSGEVNPAVVQQLKAGNPVRCLALAAVSVVMRLVTGAQEKGVKIDPAVILHGGAELFGDLANLASKLKIHTYTQQEINAGWIMAMDMARQQMQKAGMLDRAAFQRDMQEIQQAMKDGTLNEVLPGLGGKGGSGQGADQQGAEAAAAADDTGEGEQPSPDQAESPDEGMGGGDGGESPDATGQDDEDFNGMGG